MKILDREILIKEGLIRSAPLATCIRILIRKYPMTYYHQNEGENFDLFTVYFKSIPKLNIFLLIKDCINSLGWFPSLIDYEESFDISTFQNLRNEVNSNDWNNFEKFTDEKLKKYVSKDYLIAISFEPKYDLAIKFPDKVYHITDEKNIEKIKRVGLLTKNQNTVFNFPERIYVAITKQGIKDIEEIFLQHFPNRKFVELEIEAKDLKIYRDPNFADGGYVLNPISSKLIRIIDKN